MRKTKSILASALAIFTMAFFIPTINAQQQLQDEHPTYDSELNQQESGNLDFIVVADVSVYDAKIISQENNYIRISFDINNRQQIQPGVRYALHLVRQEDGKQILVDEKIYPETIVLRENEVIKKEIEYRAPEYFSGEYRIFLTVENQNGLRLAMSDIGSVSFSGNNQYVELRNCYLKVEGENEAKKYSIVQGVDIEPEESLIVYCDIDNHLNQSSEIIPEFVINRRSIFGEEVEIAIEDKQNITLNKEEKEVYFFLPKIETPQAYNVALFLRRQGGEIISNKVNLRYVVRGLSATIQNLQIDRDYYKEGESAKVSFFWSPSADNFQGSRLSQTDNGAMDVDVVIKNSNDQICADMINELDPNAEFVNYELQIKSDCINPGVFASIKDDKGNVLDSKNFKINSQDMVVKNEPQKYIADNPEDFNFKFILIFLVILFVISIIAMGIKYRNSFFVIVFCAIMGGLFLGNARDAKAITLLVKGTSGLSSPHLTINYDINSRTYKPTDSVYATASMSIATCGNWPEMSADIDAKTPVGAAKHITAYWNWTGGAINILPSTINLGVPGNKNGNATFILSYLPMEDHLKKYCAKGASTVVNGVSCWSRLIHENLYIPFTVIANPCALPWGGTIASGSSVTAYRLPSVACGSSCSTVSQTRTCTNGVLSGTYTNRTCSVQTCAAPCPLPWGGTIPSGSSVTAYNTTQTCDCTTADQTRTCTNGTLSGTYTNRTCLSITSVPGNCGAADGQEFMSEPTSDLCSSGNPSAVSGTNDSWDWTCNGICSTVNESCSANRSLDLNWKEVNPN
ncbi:MAG: hypothetical protein WC120_03875 [Parcubacteria group bacterium]